MAQLVITCDTVTGMLEVQVDGAAVSDCKYVSIYACEDEAHFCLEVCPESEKGKATVRTTVTAEANDYSAAQKLVDMLNKNRQVDEVKDFILASRRK